MITRTQLLDSPTSGAHALCTAGYIPPARVSVDVEPGDVYRAGAVWTKLRNYCAGDKEFPHLFPPGNETIFFAFTSMQLWAWRESKGTRRRRHLATLELDASGQWTVRHGAFGSTYREPVADYLGALGLEIAQCAGHTCGEILLTVRRVRDWVLLARTYPLTEIPELISLARAHRAGVVLVRPGDIAGPDDLTTTR